MLSSAAEPRTYRVVPSITTDGLPTHVCSDKIVLHVSSGAMILSILSVLKGCAAGQSRILRLEGSERAPFDEHEREEEEG